MRTRSGRWQWVVGVGLGMVGLACDPPGAARNDERPTRTARDPVADAALGDAKVVVLRDGTVEIYDRNGTLRAQVIDPQARFVDTLQPIAGTREWTTPHPDLTVPLAGLSDWLTRRGNERRARAALEAEGLTESQRMMVAIADAAESTERALATLDGELAALWADTSRPASERRRLLFQRWDESEEGPKAGDAGDASDAGDAGDVVRIEGAAVAPDAIRAQAGVRGREAIEAFVRARLPAGSGDAYATEELAALNRGRKSRRPFAPYGAALADGEATGG